MHNEQPRIWNAVEFCHEVLRRHLRSDARVVDATAGNGHDTVFLLDLLDHRGRVLAVDIQSQAVTNTRERVVSHPKASQAEVVHVSHERLDAVLLQHGWSHIDGAVMNCGYLPGGDKNVRTAVPSTVAAMRTLVSHLALGGVVCVVCYTGHEGGPEERDAVRDVCASLPKDGYRCAYFTNPGRRNAPECYCVERIYMDDADATTT
ncbi:MAG: class I SAM-dependent methyltransferase [Candidatus Kapaibacterium sp.]